MEANLSITHPLSIQQITEIVRQLPLAEKIKLASLLEAEVVVHKVDKIRTHLASQEVLAKDWKTDEEEIARQHL